MNELVGDICGRVGAFVHLVRFAGGLPHPHLPRAYAYMNQGYCCPYILITADLSPMKHPRMHAYLHRHHIPDLYDAAEAGNADRVRELLQAGAGLTYKDKDFVSRGCMRGEDAVAAETAIAIAAAAVAVVAVAAIVEACVHACMHACVLDACVRVACVRVACMRACCMRACVLHACMRVCCMRACVHACLHACMRACVRACLHACMRVGSVRAYCMHACVCAYMLACVFA